MDTLNSILGSMFDGTIAVVGGLSLGTSLFIISMGLGVLMLLAFKWVGDPEQLEVSKDRMLAHLMEMRLFDAEPKIVFRAMADLMIWNAKFFFATLRPAIIATLPMILLFIQMEHYYGVRPIRPGESAVVTASLADFDAAKDAVKLEATGPIEVETRPTRSNERGWVSWRVRGIEAGSGVLSLTAGGTEVQKTLDVGRDPTVVSMRRASQPSDLLLYPRESSIAGTGVRWIEVQYPVQSVDIGGIATHWLVWLVVISIFGALAVRVVVNAWRPRTL